VGPDIDYVKVLFTKTGDRVVLAKERLSVIKEEHEILGELKAKTLSLLSMSKCSLT